MIHLELFAGIGGFRLVFGEKYVTIPIEYDKKELEVYQAIFDEKISLKDVTKTNFSSLKGKIDVLTAGFPCQPFSTAKMSGKSKLSADLWKYPVKIAIDNDASFIMLENVPNFCTSRGFVQLVDELKRAKYHVSMGILKGTNFCSPTIRKRLCILASTIHSEQELKQSLEQTFYPLPLFSEDFLQSFPSDTIKGKFLKILNDKCLGAKSVNNHQIVYQNFSKKIWSEGILPTFTKNGHFSGSSGLALYPQRRLLMGLERLAIHGFPIVNVKHFSNNRLFQVSGNSIVIPAFKAVRKFLGL